jgi:hypothetical protein
MDLSHSDLNLIPMEDTMSNYSDRKWLVASLAVGLCIVKPALSEKVGSEKLKDSDRKSSYIAAIKGPDKPLTKTQGGSLRDLYVARLSELDSNLLDAETLNLFTDLIENDENAWVRLEAVATIVNIPIPKEKIPKVSGLLEKYRNDQRVNFQVLASQSLLRLGRKHGTATLQAEKTLAKIAQGTGMAKWTVMIPSHNVGTMIMDPGSKSQITFEEFAKTNLRLNAVNALAKANSDFSKKVISDLAQDSNQMVREAAQAISVRAKNEKVEK